ncbi:SDR family oxidoreductase [Aspergillus homomorphus CBS 101889]|uniref:Hydroxyacyl dehydrogenase n=1 Tax=Aspergillus homomorphus (strain CBS 101889) TaxID=1450537 RepID=A0A395HQE7_ASPHC|nr:hydroxyacyl dehydrogenase [Aspergillus homomorphus CBS 101889]RAL08474.1 hydroxyacyl dehydrogenase [Aspergillus homomorphus CBS 101889]
MSNVLVTGSSRGLGLELVRQLTAQRTSEKALVVATARKCSSELHEVISGANGTIVFVPLDVTDERTIAQSAESVRSALGDRSLDILINCAGVHSETHGKITSMSDLDFQLKVNVTGTHNVIRHYLPLMQNSTSKKVVNISSTFGSLTKAREVFYAPCPAYKISKAALNALTVQYALSYEDEGFVFIAVNPGWLQSDMGGQDADLTVPQGAEAVLNTIMAANSRDNGCFKNIYVPGWAKKYDGENAHW